MEALWKSHSRLGATELPRGARDRITRRSREGQEEINTSSPSDPNPAGSSSPEDLLHYYIAGQSIEPYS